MRSSSSSGSTRPIRISPGTSPGSSPSRPTMRRRLIDDFSKKDNAPHIAISVDMLDTGIDVPEVVNLVLFKLIRSKTKFWQIIGRGTRLCPDLFGPGEDKEFFRVFDYCQNLEFFKQNPKPDEGKNARSLSERLFAARFDLVQALDEKNELLIKDVLREPDSDYDAGPSTSARPRRARRRPAACPSSRRAAPARAGRRSRPGGRRACRRASSRRAARQPRDRRHRRRRAVTARGRRRTRTFGSRRPSPAPRSGAVVPGRPSTVAPHPAPRRQRGARDVSGRLTVRPTRGG